MKIKTQIDKTVREIWIGIWLFTFICFIVSVWFVHNRIAVATGLVLGALLACFSIWHMWHTLDCSLGAADEKSAARTVGSGYLIRYMSVILLVAVLYFTRLGDPFAAFIAYMCIKPAAYIQPRIHRIINRKAIQEEH